MIGIIFDVVFVGFIASLFVNIVLSVKLFDVTKYNKMLVESAKERIKYVNSLVKQRNNVMGAYSTLKYGLKQRVDAAPALNGLMSDNYSPHAGCVDPKKDAMSAWRKPTPMEITMRSYEANVKGPWHDIPR